MFTHLHLHTEFSLLDGLTRINPLMERVSQIGQKAVALTDHGAMYGAIDFYRAARKHDIKPILGVEAYVAPTSRLTRDVGDKQPFHLTMLAKNKTGYRNLLKLVTTSHLDGYYYRPRMDRDVLEKHSDGIIVLSGCPSGELMRLIQDGRMDEARSTINWYREVFHDGYYLEVQHHDLPEFAEAGRTVVQLARELDIPLVATNDSHYLTQDDHGTHDVLLCIGTNATVHDEKRMSFSDPSYYVTSEDEMRLGFPELPDAIDNTWKIAEECELELEFGRLHMPEPEVPAGETPDSYLERLCWEGLRARLPYADETSEDRLRYELDVVRATGFVNYIHIVREIAMFARGAKMRFGVRGSAAASLILYCLYVTDIDPLKSELVFERFLNKERPEAPDVDFDFPDDRREEVLRFVAERYGSDRVAQIITFGTLGAKAAIRDVGRALGMNFAETDRVARLIPNALHMTLDRALKESNDLAAIYETDRQVRDLIDQAKKLEGVARNSSTHAAGVVISKEPLVEHLPLARPARGEQQAMPTTQFPMENVAAIGLVKMDLLGLSNLTILEKALDLVEERHGMRLDLENLPDGDPKAFAMLGKGETFGVFQLESSGMRRAVLELRPTQVSDLAALVALYRPGPMQHIGTFCRAKHGEAEIVYPHPDLADILNETYGVITYQDQVLKIAQKFAGYSLGAADIMRKAMGKKIAAIMVGEKERFFQGALEKGYTKEETTAVFELIEPFAGYAFNKAHSFSYGTIAYQTAFLKANYPEEYLTAVLRQADSHPSGALERIAQAYNECVRLGIPVLPPDVNFSEANFSLEPVDGKTGIRFGLSMIKNVGTGAAEEIVDARARAGGNFASLNDFCRVINTHTVNKRALESLAKAGALDTIAGTKDARGSMLLNLDRIVSIAQSSQKLRETGQTTMFDLFGEEVAAPLAGIDLQSTPIPKSEILAWEKELLGVWLSEHPFTHAAPSLAPHVTGLCSEITPELLSELPPQGRDYIIAGMVGTSRRLSTRDGRAFIACELEDLSGTVEVTVWPDVYERTPELWTKGKIVLCQVRVRERGERLTAGVQEVVGFEDGFDPPAWLTNPQPQPTASRRGGYSNRAPAKQPVQSVSYESPVVEDDLLAEPEEGAFDGIESPYESSPSVITIERETSPPVFDAPPSSAAGFTSPPQSPSPSTARGMPDPETKLAAAPGMKSKLCLSLQETEDEAADQARLATVFELLQANPGSDEVLLSIKTIDGESIDLALPSAALDDSLRARLQQVLREPAAVG